MNRRLKIAFIWLSIGVVSFLAMLLPIIFGEDNEAFSFDYGIGGALMAFGFLFFITGLITFFFYVRMGLQERKMRKTPSSVLAKWEYSEESWTAYVNTIFGERKKTNRRTFFLIAGITAILAVPIGLFLEDMFFTATFCIGLLIFLFFVSMLTPLYQRRKLLKADRSIVISENGIIRGSEFHPIGIAGTFLESVRFNGEQLEIVYYSYSGTGKNDFNVLIQVPESEKEQAQKAFEFYKNKLENK